MQSFHIFSALRLVYAKIPLYANQADGVRRTNDPQLVAAASREDVTGCRCETHRLAPW